MSVTTPDGTRWRYTYDPLGRRTAKLRLSPDGESVLERVDFTWDGTTLCEQTTTSPGLPHPVTLTWDHHGLRPLSQTERIAAADAAQGFNTVQVEISFSGLEEVTLTGFGTTVTADILLSADNGVTLEVTSPATRIRAVATTAFISKLTAYLNG